jgi:5-methylcytosine-specific restriction protein A
LSRSLPEWIAKHDDEAIPPRVKLRIFERCNGICKACTLAIRGKLLPAYDHITALVNGGEHRESNLQLLCVPCHAVKTRQDVAEKAQTYSKRLKAVGIKPARKHRWGIPGMKKKITGEVVPR